MSIRPRLLAALFVASLALTGCAAEVTAASPSPSTPMPSTPSPTPASAPVTCDALVPESVLDSAGLERGPLQAHAEAVASTVLGGVSCLWAWPLLQVAAYPLDTAPAELRARFAEPVCDGWGYDGRACYVSGIEGDYWFYAAVGVPADLGPASAPDAAQSEVLSTLADSVAGGIRASAMPVAATVSAGWWAEPACDEFTATIEWPWPMGDFPGQGYPFEGGWNPAREVIDTHRTLTDCVWTDDGSGAEGSVFTSTQAQVVPGGGAAGMPDGVEGDPADVEGADSALLHVDDQGVIRLAMIDGENFVEVIFQSRPNGSGAVPIGADAVVDFAGSLLAELEA